MLELLIFRHVEEVASVSNHHPHMGGYAVGSVVGGRYRVEMVLAQRSSSVVCLGLDLMQAPRTVLIYSVPDYELAHRVELLRGLFQDAQIVNVLKRDDLVQVLDFNIEPTSRTLFLVMEHRTGLPADQLVALGGPENKTAAVFVEMARGLLDSYDSQFLHMKESTNPGVTVNDLAPYRAGPRSGTVRSVAPMSTTGAMPLSAVPSAPKPRKKKGKKRRTEVVYGQDEGVWQEAEDVGAGSPPPPRRSDGPQLTKNHLLIIGFITAGLATAIFVAMGEQRQYYGPQTVERGGWHDYYGQDRASYGGPGLGSGTRAPSQITVTSSPQGALVYAGIKQLGATPLQMDRPKNRKQLLLRISKVGYIDRTVVVSSSSPAMISVSLGRSTLSKSAEEPTKASGSKSKRDPDRIRLPTYDIGAPPPSKTPATSGYDTTIRR